MSWLLIEFVVDINWIGMGEFDLMLFLWIYLDWEG